MRRLTQAELAEPDITVIIPDNADLPREVKLTLDCFVGKYVKGGVSYSLPAYLARELNELARIHHQALQPEGQP